MIVNYHTFYSILVVVIVDRCWGSTVVKFSRCGVGGFTCVNLKSKNVDVTYQCPAGTEDVAIFINQFNSPANIESFNIKNCQKLTISTRCTGEKKAILVLRIMNIQQLTFQRLQYQSHLPSKVYLENIGYISTIPSYTFSQIDKSIHTVGCIIPREDFRFLYLKNVSIDTIQSDAFNMPSDVAEISFSNVNVNRLQNSALRVKLEKFGKFSMERSSAGVIEHLAFQITGKNVSFVANEFVELSSSGINGTMENFRFTNNSVNTLNPHALAVLATNVFILNNRFQYLKSGALEKVSPGLMEDSGRSFGSLRFIYQFNGNEINFMDAGSLHPDVSSYENVASDMEIRRNGIYCSCDNSGWLMSEIGHGSNHAILDGFYEQILDDGEENFCSWTCDLPLTTLKRMAKAGKCNPNITMEWLCNNKDVTTVMATINDEVEEQALDVIVDEIKTETLVITGGTYKIMLSYTLLAIVFLVLKF